MVERSSADNFFSQIEREDPNFRRKLDLITAGAPHFLKEHLLTKITRENCLVIINYILATYRLLISNICICLLVPSLEYRHPNR